MSGFEQGTSRYCSSYVPSTLTITRVSITLVATELRLLDKLHSITVDGGCLVRGDKILLPGELWACASKYAGAALGLGQVLGRPVATESIHECFCCREV